MERRLMRLVWNSNNWETPIYKKHNPELWKNGKNNASFEKSFGFGGEDWLFNSRFNIDGFQYGYIRGVDRLSIEIETIDELYLYTIDPESQKRLLVFKICNVEIIEGYQKVQKIISPIIEKSREFYISDLISAQAYFKALDKNPMSVNIRFKLEDVTKYGYLNEINELKTPSFNRFTPYIVDVKLLNILTKNLTPIIALNFKKGKAKSVKSHKRNISEGIINNPRLHSKITDDLYKYLLEIKSIKEDYISIENSRIGGKIIDGLIKNPDKFSFFEIKTASNPVANIREAIGQLLEYSHLDKSLSVEKLIVVGPAKMSNKEEKEYFERIKKTINIKLEYWAYSFNETALKTKFIIY